jgi:ribosome-binding factor A
MNKEKTQRQQRIEKRILRVVSTAFIESSFSIKEEKLFVNINKVDISPDLKNVSIFCVIVNISDKDKKMIIKELNKSEYKKTIKKIIAQDLNLRVAPEPVFILDNKQERNNRVLNLIEMESKKYGNK